MGKKDIKTAEEMTEKPEDDFVVPLTEEDGFPTGGRGNWDTEGINKKVQGLFAKYNICAVKTYDFIDKYHPSGRPKYAGYYVKQKIEDAMKALNIVGKAQDMTKSRGYVKIGFHKPEPVPATE